MDEPEGSQPGRSSRGRLLGAAVTVVVVVVAGVAVYRDRRTFGDAVRHVGVWGTLASFACGVVGVAATFPVWRQVLLGLDVDMPRREGARVFFPSQLGKYLPGAVWPILLQVEAGRRHGASRRTMVTTGALSLIIGCSSGLLVACLLLPLSDVQALSRYWYAVFAVPLLLVLLHPRALPMVLDRGLRVLHRPPSGERLRTTNELRACGWALVSWVGFGGQLAVLCDGLGKGGFSTLVLCTGAMGLAVSLGVLFIPAPAGAGVREVVLTLALGTVLRSGDALALVVASRALLVVADLFLAVLGLVAGSPAPRSVPAR